jgi:hypothetical protein
MSHGDWIPGREHELAALIAIWQTRLSTPAMQTAYGWPAAECAATIATFTAFNNALTAYAAAPTKGNHDLKEEARTVAIAAMRKFANAQIRYNAKMNTSQREELGIFPRDPEPTPVPVPDFAPESIAELDPQTPGIVTIRYRRPKPPGVAMAEAAFGISATPVESAEQLTERESFSHNPLRLTFGAAHKGGKLYFALRWRTLKGAGPWSAVREVTVP